MEVQRGYVNQGHDHRIGMEIWVQVSQFHSSQSLSCDFTQNKTKIKKETAKLTFIKVLFNVYKKISLSTSLIIKFNMHENINIFENNLQIFSLCNNPLRGTIISESLEDK